MDNLPYDNQYLAVVSANAVFTEFNLTPTHIWLADKSLRAFSQVLEVSIFAAVWKKKGAKMYWPSAFSLSDNANEAPHS